jgi:hypothetical protein
LQEPTGVTLNRTFLSLEVAETDKDRAYWTSRPWLTNAETVRAADVLLVPWENFRENKPALFPLGSGDLFRELSKALGDKSVAVAIDQGNYEEVALHAEATRLATLFVTLVALPFVVNLLSSKVDRWLNDPVPPQTVEMEVIVEGDWGHCLSIKYKGPPSGMVDAISTQAKECLPRLSQHGKRKPAKNK